MPQPAHVYTQTEHEGCSTIKKRAESAYREGSKKKCESLAIAAGEGYRTGERMRLLHCGLRSYAEVIVSDNENAVGQQRVVNPV